MPCTVQPRDVGIVRPYKFLTAPQLRELWWPASSVEAPDRRPVKLFRAGYLERPADLPPRFLPVDVPTKGGGVPRAFVRCRGVQPLIRALL